MDARSQLNVLKAVCEVGALAGSIGLFEALRENSQMVGALLGIDAVCCLGIMACDALFISNAEQLNKINRKRELGIF